jgi:hypothetical protein
VRVTVPGDPAVNALVEVLRQFCAVVAYVIPAGLPPPHEPHVEFPF